MATAPQPPAGDGCLTSGQTETGNESGSKLEDVLRRVQEAEGQLAAARAAVLAGLQGAAGTGCRGDMGAASELAKLLGAFEATSGKEQWSILE